MNERIVIEIVGRDRGATSVLGRQTAAVEGLSRAFKVDLFSSLIRIRQEMERTTLAIRTGFASLPGMIRTSSTAIPAAIAPALRASEAQVASWSVRVRAMIGRAFTGGVGAAGILGGRALSGAGGLLGGLLGGAGNAIGNIGGSLGGGKNILSGLIGGITNASRSIADALTSGVSKGVEGVGKLLSTIPKFLGDTLSAIPKFGTALAAPFRLAAGAIQGFASAVSGLVGLVGGVFKAAVGVAGTALNGLVTVAQGIVRKVAQTFGGLVSMVGGIMGKVVKTAGVVLGGIVTVATVKSLSFRKEMRRAFGLIAQDLQEAGADGAQRMRNEFFQIARDVLADSGSLKWAAVGRAVYDTISAGFRSAAEVKPILEAAALATVAGGGDDPAPFVRALTKAMTQFEIPAERAKDVADRFFNTVNFGVVTVEQLAEILPGVGAVARSAGLDLERTLTLIAEATKRLDLETSSSGLQQFLLAVAAPDEGALKARQKLGLKTTTLTPAQQKQSDALKSTIAGYEAFVEQMERAEKKTHAQRMALRDAKKELVELRQALEDVQKQGAPIDPIEFLRSLQALDLSAAQLKEVVGGRVQAFRFAAAFTGGKAAQEAGIKPGAKGAGLDDFAKTEQEIRERSAGAAQAAAAEMERGLGHNLRKLFTNIGLLWDSVMGRIASRSAEGFAGVHAAFDGFRRSVEEWVASGQLDHFFGDVQAVAAEAFGFLGDLISGITWEDVKAGAADAWNVVSTLGKATWEAMKLASKLAGTIMSGNIRGPLGAAFDFVKDAGTRVWNALVGLGEGDTTGFGAIFKRLEAFFLRVIARVAQGVGKIIDAVLEAAAATIETLGGGVNATIAGLGRAAGIPGLLDAAGVVELDQDFTGAEGAARGLRGAKGGLDGSSLDARAQAAEDAARSLETLHAEALRNAEAAREKADADKEAARIARESARDKARLDEMERQRREERLAKDKAEREAFFADGGTAPGSPKAAQQAAEQTTAAKKGALASEKTSTGVEGANAKLQKLVDMAGSGGKSSDAERTIADLKHQVRLESAPSDAARKAIERERELQEIRARGGEEAVKLARTLWAIQDAKARAEGAAAGRDGERRSKQNRKSFSRPFSSFGGRPGTGIGGGIFGTFAKRPTLVETEEKALPFFARSAEQRAKETVERRERQRALKKRKDLIGPVVTGTDGVPEQLLKDAESPGEKRERLKREIERETKRIRKKDRRVQSFVSDFSGEGAAGGLDRMTREDVQRRKLLKKRGALRAAGLSEEQIESIAPKKKELIPDSPSMPQNAEELEKAMKGAQSAKADEVPKAAEKSAEASSKAAEAAKAAQEAMKESLDKGTDSIDEVGKTLKKTGEDLSKGFDTLTKATTGILKEHATRLEKIETDLEEHARERDAMRATSERGAGG